MHVRLWTAILAVSLCLSLMTALHHGQGSEDANPAPKQDKRTPKELAQEHVRRARRLIDFGRPLLAKKQLDLALAQDPQSRDVMLWQLRLYTRSTGGAEDARKWAQALAKNFPDDYEACFEIANFLFITQPDLVAPNPGKDDEVKAALTRLKAEIEIFQELADYIVAPAETLPGAASPRADLSLAWLARASRQTPRTGEVCFLAAQELDFRARRFESFSKLHERFGPFGEAAQMLLERAEKLYRRVIETSALDLTARAALCQVLLRLKRYEEARRECDAALLLSGENAPVTNRLTAILIDVASATGDQELLIANLELRHRAYNDVDSALDLSAARRIRDSKWPFVRWREYRVVFGLRGEARLQGCGELLQLQPDFLEIHLLAAEALISRAETITENIEARNSWYEGAVKAVDKAAELGEKLPDASRLRALALWHLGRYEDAAEAFTRTARLDPEDEYARRYARAARDIAAGLYSAPDYMALLNLGRDSDFKLQRSLLESLVKRAPRFFDAWLMLGEVNFLQKFNEEALAAYKQALELGPENLQALYGAGFASINLGDYQQALKHWETLNALSDDYRGTRRWVRIARSALTKGKARAEAVRTWIGASTPTDAPRNRKAQLEKAVEQDPTFSEALTDLARLLREEAVSSGERNIGMLERAEVLLGQAWQHAEDNYAKASARLELGRVRVQLRRFESAAEDMEAAFALDRDDGTSLMMAALARRALGDEAGAAALMRRLYAEVPDSILLRPSDQVLTLLGLAPVKAQGARAVTPRWTAGEKLKFDVSISGEGEGGEVGQHRAQWGFEMRVEVAATPENGGVWKLIVTFAPGAAAAVPGLEELRLQVELSPWFGLVRNPLPASRALADAVDPAISALCDALCLGLGDSQILPPYGWRNERTQGPAHYSGEGYAEAAAVEQLVGDNLVVRRVAARGRYAGGDPEYVNDGGRVECVAELAGARCQLRRLTLTITNEQLAETDDDVISSKLSVKLTAR